MLAFRKLLLHLKLLEFITRENGQAPRAVAFENNFDSLSAKATVRPSNERRFAIEHIRLLK
jgi:hypothetical protein